MACGIISLILLLCLNSLATETLGDQGPCKYVRMKGSMTIDFELKEKSDYRWLHNSSLVFEFKKDKYRKGNSSDVNEGSLVLKNLKASDSGIYQAEAFDKDGRSSKNKPKSICVIEISKPVAVEDCKNSMLRCKGNWAFNRTFTWTRDKSIVKDITSNTMKFTPKETSSKYKCTVKIGDISETSDEIEIKCQDSGTKPGPNDNTLFGLDFWVMIGILAAGGSLLLILVVVIVICICRRQRHGRKRMRDEEELRLANLMHQPHPHGHHGHKSPPHKTHPGQYEDPPALPKPRSNARPRPAPPATPIRDGEQPPPRPKPRKKEPRVPRN
ncbi:hypothetical protein AGOR_G00217290 [Albula goreensis]|uniref:Ig-like domain-containing protein n=1 Tax=Albula goreensis TaxID=1534307 RepID=A0A8T3CL42_9TELE|nr:hypothetical protein AGOR_G00217290 [Albula goreensis]